MFKTLVEAFCICSIKQESYYYYCYYFKGFGSFASAMLLCNSTENLQHCYSCSLQHASVIL